MSGLCGLVYFAMSLNLTSATESPNIIFIITDDQGFGDLGAHGNPILQTPSLDHLHSESLRLTDYHVAPTCSPTRASLLTGQWANRTGVWHTIAGRSLLSQRQTTFATMLRESGYRTAMVGKWHLGDNVPFRPEDHGFDEVFYHGGGGLGQTPDAWDNGYFDAKYYDGMRWSKVPGFCTDVLFARARQFIARQIKVDEPFLLYLSTNAPHSPMHAPPEWSAPYLKQGLRDDVANFFGMIANIDDNVGKLRAYLDEEGIADNTVLIFTTDNGTSRGQDIWNANMRGAKGSPYDGGHRVPFFLHWPRGGFDEGVDDRALSHAVDVLPTLLKIAGMQLPDDVVLDGQVMTPFADEEPEEERIVFVDSQRVNNPIKWRQSAVLTSQWRLVNRTELYDIIADPAQEKNVAADYPDVAEKLQKAYEKWWLDLEPFLAERARISVKAEHLPVRLNCHDWIDGEVTAWNQQMIRKGNVREVGGGTWAIDVAAAGEYIFRVRRWPMEVSVPITVGVAAGLPQPGEKGFREEAGRALPIVGAKVAVGDQIYQSDLVGEKEEVTISVPLPAGPADVRVQYILEGGAGIGAYYVEVDRVDSKEGD